MSKYDNLPQLIIRGAAGLGDSVYLHPIVEHFSRIYNPPSKVTICSHYPDLFKHLGVKTEPFRRSDVNLVSTYAHSRNSPFNQWRDMLKYASLPDIAFRIKWKVQNEEIVKYVRDRIDKPIVVFFSNPHRVFDNCDNKFRDVEIDYQKMQELVNNNTKRCFFIQVGQRTDHRPHVFKNIDLNMVGKTTPASLMDICTLGEVFMGLPSYLIPIAQGFKRKLFIILSHKMATSSVKVLNQIKPHKYRMHKNEFYVWDNIPVEQMDKEFKKCLSS